MRMFAELCKSVFPLSTEWEKRYTWNQVANRIAKCWAPQQVSVKITRGTTGKSPIVISGLFNEELDAPNDVRVNIALSGLKGTQKTNGGTQGAFFYFLVRVAQAANHELIHRWQYASGGPSLLYKVRPSQMRQNMEYLGDMNEVEAYASDVAIDWYMAYGEEASTQFSNWENLDMKKVSPFFGLYIAVFPKTHPVFKALCKEIHSLFESIQEIDDNDKQIWAYIRQCERQW